MQPGLGGRIQIDTATGKANLGLLDLIEVLRQQLGHAALILGKCLGEPDRQQAHLRHPAIARGVADHRTASVDQAADQACGLGLGAVEEDVAAADSYRAQVDITASRLPGCSGRQQGGRTTAHHCVVGIQTKRRLFPGAPHEFTRAEIGDRLSQPAFEFVAFDRPLDALQASLESECHRGKAGKHAEQG
ncbi:hypothetical protein D3C76_1267220 [compost metagenome]